MKNKIIAALIAIIILAGVIYLIEGPLKNRSQQVEQLFSSLNTEEVTKIQIASIDQETILQKSGEEWVVASEENAKADQSLVKSILSETKGLTKENIASTNPDKKSVFEVDESGVVVTFFGNDQEIVKFYVGKLGPDYSSFYIRPEGEDTVYLSKNNLRSQVTQTDFKEPPPEEVETTEPLEVPE